MTPIHIAREGKNSILMIDREADIPSGLQENTIPRSERGRAREERPAMELKGKKGKSFVEFKRQQQSREAKLSQNIPKGERFGGKASPH